MRGVEVSEIDETAKITILCDDSNERVITLEGISRIRVDNFVNGNIILSIEVYDTNNIPKSELVKLYNYDVCCNNIRNNVSRSITDKILERKLVLLVLTPSIGCEILALCKTVNIA